MTLLTFVFGLAVGILVMWLLALKKEYSIKVTWYEWLLIAAFVCFMAAGIILVNSFIEESVGGGVLASILICGVGGAICLVIAWQLIYRHNRKTITTA